MSERRPIPDCQTCGGTGWQLLMNSWFKSDGLRRERCGICAGSGKNAYRDDPAFIRRQAEWRRETGATS